MKIRKPLIIIGLVIGVCASAQMPLFRNSFTTNVPGAYVRGHLAFGDEGDWYSGLTATGRSIFMGPLWHGGPAGTGSVSIGFFALTNMEFATAVGGNAGQHATQAVHGTFVGRSAGQWITNAESPTAIGANSALRAYNANQGTFLGAYAGYRAENGTNATMVGRSAGLYASNSPLATFVGHLAGRWATNAPQATFLGAHTGPDASILHTNVGNSVAIGYNSKVTGTNQFILGTTHNVGIKTNNPGYALDIHGSLHSTSAVVNSSVTITGGTASDYFGFGDHDKYLPFVGGAGFLMSAGSLTFDIDSNNDHTDRIFKIEHNSNTGAGAELMRVQENGNVGIGTNDPQYTLHVHGTVAATNFLANGLGIGTNSTPGNLVVHGEVNGTNVTVWPPRWDDVRVPLSQLSSPSATPGRVIFRGGLACYGFDDNTTEQLNFELQLPHGITTNAAYGIHMHIHWTTTNAIAGANSNVVWGLEYVMADPLTLYATTTITNRITNAIPATFFHMLGEWPAITVNIKESAVMIGRLFREGGNASDTLSGDAIGISLDAHYPRISFGSTGEYGDY